MTTFFGIGVETRSGSHHDGRSLVYKVRKTPFAELLHIVYRQFHHDVESTRRSRSKDTRDLVQLVDEEISSSEVLVVHLLHVFFRCRERCFGYHLSEQRRTQTRLAELHHRLTNGFVLGDERTDTNTTLTIPFGHAVHQHHVLLYSLQMAGRDIRRLGVDKLTIDLIGDQIEVVFLHQIAYLPHLLFGIEIARRVIGVTDEDSSGLRRDLFLKLLYRRQLKAVLDVRLHGFDHSSAGDSKRHIVRVTRVGHNDLIARIQTTHVRKHDRFRASGSDDDLVR